MGGGLELALVCDQIVADKMARFGFPELRLGLIPGFGGIPRLRRDVGNSFIRDHAVYWANREGGERAAGGAGVASCRRRVRAASGAVDGAAGDEVRRGNARGGEEIHQADSARGIAEGNRIFSAEFSTDPW